MKLYKGLIIASLLLITIVGALAFANTPPTRFTDIVVRGQFSLGTPTDNAYLPYGWGTAYLVPSATTNATVTPDKTYQIVSAVNPNSFGVSINFISTFNARIGDIYIFEGHPTQQIEFDSIPTTVDYSVNASGNQTGGLNSITQNIVLNTDTDYLTTSNYVVNNTTYSAILRNSRSLIAFIFNGRFFCEIWRCICK